MGAFSQKSFPVKLVTIFLHIAGWLVLLLIPMMLHPAPKHLSGFNNPEKVLLVMVIFQMAHIAFFYFNYQILVPKFLMNREYVKYVLWVVFVMFLVQLIPIVAQQTFIYEGNLLSKDFRRAGKFMSITFGLLIVASSTGFRLLNDWLKLESEAKELANEKLLAELSYLKAQIDPHFFFNTLNGIYSLSITQPDKVPNYLLRLSQFIRFVINEDTNQLISIEDEVNHLKDYVELQKLRLSDKTRIKFEVNIENQSLKLSPHLFLPFVENALKYGVSASKESEIYIHLFTQSNQIFFEVLNAKLRENSEVSSNLIGIKNVKRRLELIYPEKHVLLINELPNSFQISLQINNA
jgi:sensor histidine kinase YesM